MQETTATRLADIRRRMAEAAHEAGRAASDVTLIAVSKTFGAEAILPAIEARQRVFGENRVQEAKAKWPALRERYADLELHLIGPLQTNKVREAVALFDVIHTLDREKLARVLAEEMERTGRRPRLLVQVNTGEESQKAGVAPDAAVALVALCRERYGLTIEGLMCIPPVEEAPAPHFAFLAKLGGELGLRWLSMGMSADFETAIRFGATHIRVGSAIFGDRG